MTAPRDPFSSPDPDRPSDDTSGQPWGQPGTGSSPTQPPDYGSPQYEAPPYGAPPPVQPPYGQPEPGQQYGQQPYGQAPYGQQPHGARGTRNGLGIAALVLGILALLTGLFVIGGLLGLAAIVLGVLGRGRAKRGEADNGGMALAGIILGVLGLLLSILVVVGAASLFSSQEFSNLADCLEEAGSDAAAQQECQRDFEQGVFDQS